MPAPLRWAVWAAVAAAVTAAGVARLSESCPPAARCEDKP
jgi:hypothetical protein